MTPHDLDLLIEWLGKAGAIAGLDASDLTASNLTDLAKELGLKSIEKKMKRRDLISEIVNGRTAVVEKSRDELLAMDYRSLKEYFEDRRVSRTELLNILSQLDVRPKSEARKNLIDFAAREISDIGMFGRVAKGARSDT